ncbi:branched-chain-amino-acid aminotransferase, cytosolic-like [Xenia sp. Carnegie-2017]|uniref:branched-chain-amino-acid aminotransferase, cytosolic-like n=1 Tax=Xenia sp. Carnegie-2017 TaxID=2897299 RepID=UPI001F042BFA|nr:branched-chain-amino-acid aminotransferase, cytosolic-like [Xenia sp. Carnegie-2017]
MAGFEGMKAYFGSYDGQIRLFRPMENVKRLQRTAERLCLPSFDGEEFIKCMVELVKLDKDWAPKEENCSMYIRPTFIGTGPTLGVNKPKEALLYCILSPVGPYFKTGSFNPVTLMADATYVRSWHGGCGDCKMGGNYAPSLYVQDKAHKKKCEQVLWLYGEDEQITEVGTMNIFLFIENENGVAILKQFLSFFKICKMYHNTYLEDELISPPLDGLILPGVTRKSMIELAHKWVKEIFGAGTACVVCPVKDILYKDEMLHIPTMENGPKIARRFYKELTDIQYGKVSSPWANVVNDSSDENENLQAMSLN